jgi:hypothetical protein
MVVVVVCTVLFSPFAHVAVFGVFVLHVVTWTKASRQRKERGE